MSRVIVFDLDDTLFPEHEFVYSGFRAVDNWITAKYLNSGFYEVAERFFKEGKRGNIFNLCLDQLGIECQPLLIQELIEIYRSHKPKLSLFADALWAVNHLSINHQLGMITDGYLITQQNKVEALGIASFFQSIIYSDYYGRDHWKPSPTPYVKLMELSGKENSTYVYIADNPTKDFVTAKKLDWLTIHICRDQGEYSKLTSESSHAAHFKLSSLLELKNILPYF